jgi:transposase InsO family protein
MTLAGIDQAWVTDIPHTHPPAEFVHLACVPDAYARRAVGWGLAAPERARAARRPAPGLVHHSDRGVQHASRTHVARPEAADARPSMSAVGDPCDNAKVEAFFRTPKREEARLNEPRDLAEARAGLGRFIEEACNEKRLHSALGYRPPAELEAIHSGHEAHRTHAVVR